MSKITKKITALILAMTMILSTNVLYASEKYTSVELYVDDVQISEGLLSAEEEGLYLVPLRAVAEALGCEVLWDKDTKTATALIVEYDYDVSVTVGSDTAYLYGIEYTLEFEPTIINGNLYISMDDLNMLFLIESASIGDSINIYSMNFGVYDDTFDQSMLYVQMAMMKQMLTILETDEFNNLMDLILESKNLKLLLNEIITNKNFKPAMEDLLYSDSLFAMLDEVETYESYGKYIEDVKALDSYKKVCEETGYDNLFLDTRTLDINEYLEYQFKIFSAPSYLELSIDCIQLDSYMDFFIEFSGTDMKKFEELAEAYFYEISESEALMNLFMDLEASENLQNLINEVLESEELEKFTAYIENLFTMPEYTDEEIEELGKEFAQKIIATDEFKIVMTKNLASENFNNFLYEVLESENFKALYEKTAESEIFDEYINEVKTLDSYKQYCIELKELESYQKVLSEAGYTFEEVENASMEDIIEISINLSKTPSYVQYQLDSMKLESFEEYINELLELESFNTVMEYLSEDIFESEEFYGLMTEIENSENLYLLMEEIQKMPEFEALLNIYMEFIFSIIGM